MPEEFFRNIKNKIKKEWKIAFFSTIILGFLTHMYVFTNMLPNHDGLINIYNSQLKFKSGRFFLGPFSGISSYFDLPWINGTLSILYIAITVVLLVEIFELRKTPAIILTAGLVVTFPTIAATFSYLFTADGYMAGNLLAVLAVYITKKFKFGFLPASLIFYLSVGIYQANLTIVLTIVTVWFIRELVANQVEIISLFKSLVRFIAMTVIGMALYAVTFKTYQKIFAGEVTDYQGLSQIGARSGSLMDQLVKIKDSALELFFRGFITDSPVNLFEVLNVLLVVLIVAAVGLAIFQNKSYRSPFRLLLALLSLLLLPIFGYVLYFVSPGVEYHMLMVLSLVSIYLIPIVFYDRLEKPSLSNKWFSWSTVIVLFLIVFNFAVINNISYFNMSLKYEKTYAFMNRILDRAEQTEGYEKVTKLAVVGKTWMRTEVGSEKIPESIPYMTGAMGEVFLVEPYHYEYMLANHFGKRLTRVEEDLLQSIKESESVKQMELWPAKDSIRIEGDTLIIKFSQ